MKKKPVNKNLVTYMGLKKPVTREPTKNHPLKLSEKILKHITFGRGDDLYLIEYYTPTREVMYLVQRVENGKKEILGIRESQNAAYQIYHRVEKKLTGW